MSDSVCIAYEERETANKVLNELRELQVEHLAVERRVVAAVAAFAWRCLQGALVAAAAVGPGFALAQSSPPGDAPLRGFPLAVVCLHGATADLYYLTRIRDDGRAFYAALDGGRGGSVTADGRVEAQTEIAPGSCQGKTLEELRAEWRTIEPR
jgi:hypothetical protein